MKVVLCFLPERFGRGKIFSLPPLGILNIATYLKSTNIDVSVIDAFVKGWDLSKIVNPNLKIDNVKLLIKEGGKSGVWTNPDGLPKFLDNIF